jgi:hypothetical protein
MAAVRVAQLLNSAYRCTASGDADGVLGALAALRGAFFGVNSNSAAAGPAAVAMAPAGVAAAVVGGGGGDSGGGGGGADAAGGGGGGGGYAVGGIAGLALVPEYAPELLNGAFLRHRDARVRRSVAQLCEDVVKRLPQMATFLLPAFEALVADADAAVALRAITAMANTMLPAAVRVVTGQAGGTESPPPAPADVVATWQAVERATARALDAFFHAPPPPKTATTMTAPGAAAAASATRRVLAATVQLLADMVVALSRPTQQDDEYAVVSALVAQQQKAPSSSSSNSNSSSSSSGGVGVGSSSSAVSG